MTTAPTGGGAQALPAVPYPLAPDWWLPGEALHSATEHVARSMGGRLGPTLLHVGIRRSAADTPLRLTTRIDGDAAVRASRLLNMAPTALTGMTLQPLSGLLDLTPGRPRGWAPLPHSRWCPACLSDTGGRWQLRWRLPWSFACTTHEALLLDQCTRCQCRPHERWVLGAHPPAASRCRQPASHIAGRMTRDTPLCDQDLAAIPARPVNEAILRAQHLCDDVAEAAFWESHGALSDAGARQRLEDLDALTRRATVVMRAGIRAAPASVQALLCASDGPLATPPKRGSRSQLTAAEAAVLIGTAALGLAEVDEGGPVLTWLATSAADTRDAHTEGSHNLGGSPRLRRAVRLALHRPLSPTARLRGTAAVRSGGSLAVPGLLWQSSTLDICPPTWKGGDIGRAVLSVAVALHGNEAPLSEVLEGLGGLVTPARYRGVLADLRTEAGEEPFDVVRRLGGDVPEIDYHRRRSLWSETGVPFDDRDWTLLARSQQFPVNKRRLMHAERLVNELVLGLPPAFGPSRLRPSSNEDARSYVEFWISLPKKVIAHLMHRALAVVQGSGGSEPLMPPAAHERPLTVERRKQLVADLAGDISITQAADRLGVSRPVLIWQMQADRLSGGEPLRQTAHRRMQGRVGIDHAEVVSMYAEQRMTLRQIAERLGVSRHLIRDVMAEAGHATERGVAVDSVWLRRRHVDEGVPLRTIAGELAVSPSALRRTAARHSIPAKNGSPGIHVRGIELPRDLHPAVQLTLRRRGGVDLLRRITTVREAPTVTAAAASIGVSPSTLSVQIARFEALAGESLFLRSKPLSWTTGGELIVQDARLLLQAISTGEDGSRPDGGPGANESEARED